MLRLLVAVKNSEIYINQPDNARTCEYVVYFFLSFSVTTDVTRRPDNFSIAEHEKALSIMQMCHVFNRTPLYRRDERVMY